MSLHFASATDFFRSRVVDPSSVLCRLVSASCYPDCLFSLFRLLFSVFCHPSSVLCFLSSVICFLFLSPFYRILLAIYYTAQYVYSQVNFRKKGK
jgi:hypothetical protein